jgi:hypothetical protein
MFSRRQFLTASASASAAAATAGAALFALLLASVSTFLYFEQARLVAEAFSDRTRQTQVAIASV